MQISNSYAISISSMQLFNIPYDTKFWREKILANCKTIAKIFSFKKLVIRIYVVRVCVSSVDGVVEISILSLRPLVNSLYLTRMES